MLWNFSDVTGLSEAQLLIGLTIATRQFRCYDLRVI